MIRHQLVRHRGYTSLVEPEGDRFVVKLLGIRDIIAGEVAARADAWGYVVGLVDDYLETAYTLRKEPDHPPGEPTVSLLVRAAGADRGEGIDVTGMSKDEFIALLTSPPPTALTLTAYNESEEMVTEVEFAPEAEAKVRQISALPDWFEGGYRLPVEPLRALLALAGLDDVDGWTWFLEVTQAR